MNVLIEKEIFDSVSNKDEQIELSFLLHIIWYNNRYKLLINEDVTSCFTVQKMTETDKELLELCFQDTIVSNIEADCIISNRGIEMQDEKVFSRTEAIKYLLQPLSIIVENSQNDAHFISAIMRCYDTSLLFAKHNDEGWVQFENAGGCGNVLNFIKARVKYFNNAPKFLRCYVLLDGDKRFPSEDIVKYDKLTSRLDEWNIKYHILEKRCMENYLPIQAIPSNNNTREWVRAYEYLTPTQRDHINISSGFLGDLTKEQKSKVEKDCKKRRNKTKRNTLVRKYIHPKINELYSNVSDSNFGYLIDGLNIQDFKTKFPEHFNNATSVYRKVLQEVITHQSNPNELENIKNDIISLI